jgi:hypothetical protein
MGKQKKKGGTERNKNTEQKQIEQTGTRTNRLRLASHLVVAGGVPSLRSSTMMASRPKRMARGSHRRVVADSDGEDEEPLVQPDAEEHDFDKEDDKHEEEQEHDDEHDDKPEGENTEPFIIKVSQHKSLMKILTSAPVSIIDVKKYIERACSEKESKFKGNIVVDRVNLFDKSDDRQAEDDDIIDKETHFEMKLGATGVKRALKRSVSAVTTEDDTEEPLFKKPSFLVRLEKGAKLMDMEELKSARQLRTSLQQRRTHTKNPALFKAYNESINVVDFSISTFTGENHKTMTKVSMKHAMKAREMFALATEQAESAFSAVLALHEEAVGDAYGLEP